MNPNEKICDEDDRDKTFQLRPVDHFLVKKSSLIIHT